MISIAFENSTTTNMIEILFLLSSLFVFTHAQACRIVFVTKLQVAGNFGVDKGPDPRSFADGLCNQEAMFYGTAHINQAYEAGEIRFKVNF